MDDVVDVRIVHDVNADLPTLLQTQDRAGNHAIVAIGLDHLVGSQLDRHGGDADCVINLRRGLRDSRECTSER